MKQLAYWIPVIIWAGVIFSFSSMSVRPATEVYWQDFLFKKMAHLAEYAIFFVFSYRAITNTTSLTRKQAAIIAILMVCFYGISDEYHQSFTPGREPKARDVVIDTIGGGIAWLLLWNYLPKAPKKLKNLARTLHINS